MFVYRSPNDSMKKMKIMKFLTYYIYRVYIFLICRQLNNNLCHLFQLTLWYNGYIHKGDVYTHAERS